MCSQSGNYGDAEQCRDADAHYRRVGDALFTLIEVLKKLQRHTAERDKVRQRGSGAESRARSLLSQSRIVRIV